MVVICMSACIPEAYFCSPLYLPICIYDGAMRLRALFFSPLPAEKEVAPAYVAHGAPGQAGRHRRLHVHH